MAYNGQLNTNEIYSAIYNMIISQEVFADNIAGTFSELVDSHRVDGTLYGDTKLYYSTDCLKSYPWTADAEAGNLLSLHRAPSPDCQEITLDVFRQIALTVDEYLSKRAWSDENAFSQFNSVMLGWIGETKRIYDATTFNVFVGTTESSTGKQEVEIDVTTATTGLSGEEKARVEAGVIAEGIAKLMVALKDISRDYNDNAYLRSLDIESLQFVWNSDAVAAIEKRDLPTIYHNQIVDKLGEYVLPARYFGTPIDSSADIALLDGSSDDAVIDSTTGAYNANADLKIRALFEQDVKVGDVTTHLFAGDALPNGFIINTTTYKTADGDAKFYVEDPTILFKVIHKRGVPYMSAFETGTDFFNPRSLTNTHYLTFGRNTLEYLRNYPFITVRKV